MNFLDGKTKKWITLAAMVLIALYVMGLKLNFMETSVLGFKIAQVTGAIVLLSVYWIWNKEISLV